MHDTLSQPLSTMHMVFFMVRTLKIKTKVMYFLCEQRAKMVIEILAISLRSMKVFLNKSFFQIYASRIEAYILPAKTRIGPR